MKRQTKYRSAIAIGTTTLVAGHLFAQLAILTVSPDSAEPGTSGLTVTFTLPSTTPPTPPAQVQPSSVMIGAINGTSISRPNLETVTAVFNIPAGEAEGVKDCSVTFPGPNGDVTLTKTGGFTVGDGGSSGGGSAINGPPASGYNLFNPMTSKIAYLMDNDENIIKSWTSSYNPGLSLYLLDDGSLLRTASTGSSTFNTGGAAGRIEQFTWDGTLSWSFDYDTSSYRTHHDVAILPNGNILMVAWEMKSRAEAEAAGRNPSLLADGELWPDHIIEVEPDGSGGTIVWEWHVWDHLVQDYDATKNNYGDVAANPGKIDLNYVMSGPAGGGADWNHINSIDYNAELDQILVSVRNFSEVWIIDHDTTTAEAAGSAGDLLYRWGNPAAYDSGDASDQQLFVQHDAHWIGDGLVGEDNILIFNNGDGRSDGDYSSVVEIVPPVAGDGRYTLGLPSAPAWIYTNAVPTDFYASRISGAQRLKNGNTLVCEGTAGHAFEVTTDGELVWEYTNAGEIFRFERYAPDFEGLQSTELALPTVSYPVVDTAQDVCYDNSSEISAPATNETFYGQDAQIDGHQPCYDVSPDRLTVYDYNTRLTWTRSPDWNGDGTIDINDKMTQSEAAAYVATANAVNFGGYSDWRLPTIKELYSLMDFRGTDPMSGDTYTLVPFIDSDYFEFAWGDTSAGERSIDSQVATSTIHLDPVMGGMVDAMPCLNIVDGRIKGYPVTKDFLVYLCRGNTSYGVNDYDDNGDGTVTDNATGLMWAKNDSGSGMLWADALAYAQLMNASNYLGHSDWRLPNAKELQSIVDYSRAPTATGSAAIDPVLKCTQIVNEGGAVDWPWYFSGTTHRRQDGTGSSAAYVCFGRATGYMNSQWLDVHGAGAQRSDSKTMDTSGYTYISDGWYFTNAPQGDSARWYNYVRLVRDATTVSPIDSDGDGMSDGDETFAGTDPGDPNSVFKTSLSGISGGSLTLSWPSANNRSYTLECCTNLCEGVWLEIGTYAATVPTNTVDLTADVPTCFFRVTVTQE